MMQDISSSVSRIVLIAGEASGDFLAARLIEAMKKRAGNNRIYFSGVGGPCMKAQGLESLFPYHDLSVMGIAEVLPRLPLILKRIRQTINHIKSDRPDILICVDSPDFCFRVAKKVKKEMGASAPIIIHYVAPTVWAWRESRAKKISHFLDGILCLFDFEPPYFEQHGLRSCFVGHPMVEEPLAISADPAGFKEKHGIKPDEKTLGLLFGSREGEIKRVGDIIRKSSDLVAIATFSDNNFYPTLIVPTLPHLREKVFSLLSAYRGRCVVITDLKEKWSAFASMDAAIAVSGTVGLELAMMKVAHVIAYKMNPITALFVRLLVRVRFAHLVNIIAKRAIVPEYIQEKCTPESIAAEAIRILKDPNPQKLSFEPILKKIGVGDLLTPSEKAADFIFSLRSERKAARTGPCRADGGDRF